VRLKADPTTDTLPLVRGVRLQADREVLTAIQVQGNVAATDAEVRRIAGVEVGAPVGATLVDEVTARLRASNRFESVEVRKRFASIADPSQIVLVIIVNEGPVKIEFTGDPDNPTRVVRRRGPNLLFAPILSSEDGYGFTYGARFARLNPVGAKSRLSFPATWGGEKKAAIDLDKTFGDERISRVLVSGSISRRTNPFFNADDDRRGVQLRGERDVLSAVRVGATVGWQNVSFLGVDESFTQAGADIRLDTRPDPVLPRNAVYVRAAWDRLGLSGGSANRSTLDARGYVGVFRQNVLAVRALRQDSDTPLPLYLKPMLGGMSNLRGFHAGTAIGDTLAAGSAELIIPLTSPLNFGQFGVSAFHDLGTVYNKGERLADQKWRRSYGGSVWFSAAFVRLNLAVAHGLGATTRVHFGGTISF
ncbi:MAG: BamA/TamA family outer membrane protein, partial [Vicinamibacterales bacterium]